MYDATETEWDELSSMDEYEDEYEADEFEEEGSRARRRVRGDGFAELARVHPLGPTVAEQGNGAALAAQLP
jgi:hypothetical protein